MPFNGIAEPQQLAVLTSVLDAVCLEAGIAHIVLNVRT